jgi:type IV secretory pathway VirD2 relaxase
MDIGELDIHLRRRHHIEAAQGRRSRLPANLRQLGAVGAVTRPGGTGSQAAVVKVGLPPKGGASTRQHLAYLQWHKGQNHTNAQLYGPGARDPQAFAQAAKQDPHQFRLIVSTKDDPLGQQRTQFIEALVHQMERDLGRQLDWIAANHYDTDNPHTHIVVRGIAQGEPLYMAKSYFEHGIRDRASAILTRMLGHQHREVQRYQLEQSYSQERLAMNGMLRGAGDPDVYRVHQQQRTQQPQALARQFGSVRQEYGVEVLRAELMQQHQRLQALQMQQRQWHEAQRREW